MHTFDFKNRTAVVTGGAQGFGLDVAKRFLESGAKVFIWDIDEKLLKSAVDEVKNPNLFYSVVDISNYQDVERSRGLGDVYKRQVYTRAFILLFCQQVICYPSNKCTYYPSIRL